MSAFISAIDFSYKSFLPLWDKKSAIRSKPRRLIQHEEGYYFPLSKQPLAAHPLIQEKGEAAVSFILLHSCYKFMHDVALIETEVVNEGASLIANNKLNYKFPRALQLDAFSVIIDETYHAYAAFDYLNQVIQKTGIEPLPMPASNPVVSAMKAMRDRFPEELRDIFTLIAVCIGEHVLIQDINSIRQEERIAPSFRQLMIDHIQDEGRHSMLFKKVMRQFWNDLDEIIKDQIGPALVEYFKLNFSLAEQKDYEYRLLKNLPLTDAQASAIMADCYSADKKYAVSLDNPVICNIVRMLDDCQVFQHLPTRQAFYRHKLLLESQTSAFCAIKSAGFLQTKKDKKRTSCEVSAGGGLTLNLHPDTGGEITENLQEACKNYNQETESLTLSGIASGIIAQALTENKQAYGSLLHFTQFINPPYLLLRNCIQIKELPPTPRDDSLPPLSAWRTPASALLGALVLTGHHAASFEDEMNGRLAHMVMPANNSAESYMRSTKGLDFHTEVLDGFFSEEVIQAGPPLSPEVIALICLRNPEKMATTTLSLGGLLKKLSKQTLDTLMQPLFSVTSQSYSSRRLELNEIPLIKKLDKGYLGIRYNHHRIQTHSSMGRLALDELRHVVETAAEAEEIQLRPGDILVINNRTCLHGRPSLASSARFDGKDRWLLRMYGYAEKTLLKTRRCPHRRQLMLTKSN